MKKIIFCVINFILLGIVGFSLVYYPDSSVETPLWEYLLWIAATFVLGGVLGFLEYKCEYYERFFKCLARNRVSLIRTGIMLLISVVVSVIVELIIGFLIAGKSSNGEYFNTYRYFFIVAACFLTVYFVYNCVKSTLKIESAFVAVALACGFTMILSSPFGHTIWDIESHYRMALAEASIDGHISSAYSQVIGVSPDYFPGRTAAQNEKIIEKYNKLDKQYGGRVAREISLPHVPAAVTLSVGRLFGLSFYAKECLAKAANLLLYVLIVFYALKKLRSGKMIFFVLALLPTNLFLAANITYDWWVTAFMMLGVAYFIGEMQRPEKRITAGETWVMCGSLALACLPKQIYFPVLFLPFFMKKNYFDRRPGDRKKYNRICVIAMVLLVLSFGIRLVLELGKGGDTRGGTDVSIVGQLTYILGNPFKYAGTLFSFIFEYISFESLRYATTCFAYLDFGSGVTACVVMLVVATVTDKNEYDLYSSVKPARTAAILLSVLGLILVPTSLYIAFTPVGLDTINGCQQRYLIPLLVSFLPFIGSPKIQNRMNRHLYNSLFAIGSAVILLMDVYETMLSRML